MAEKDIILESPSGKKFKLSVNDDGELLTNEIADLPKPGYEIKFLVDPEKVFGDKSSNDLALKFFNLFNAKIAFNTKMSYYDDDNLTLNNAGWTIRVRKKSNKKKIQYTFKKRYPNFNKDKHLNNKDIKRALKVGANDGFDTINFNNNNEILEHECEIDWGYKKATLSYSHNPLEIKADKTKLDEEIIIPGEAEAIENIIELEDLIGMDLHNIREHGPVLMQTYEGTMELENGGKLPITIDILNIKKSKYSDKFEDIVEVSFKLEDYKDYIKDNNLPEDEDSDLAIVHKLKNALYNLLLKENYLLKEDSLKTTLVLERY